MKKLVVVLLVCVMGVAAQAVLVDDFSDTDLSEYTLSRVNDGNTEGNVSFASAAGDLRLSYSGSNSHEQVLFLRDDYTLGVGEMLLANVDQGAATWDRDLGIAVGFTETPTALADGESGDVRTSYVEVCLRSSGQVSSYARDGSTNENSGVKDVTGVTALFIERLAAATFQVGYFVGGTKYTDLTILWQGSTPLPAYEITTDTPGAAVGIYADARAAITESPSGILDLQIVPEPATMLLLGMGSLLGLRKRK